MPKTAAKPDRLKQAHERLTEAVESIVSGDDWKRMLKVASKFHRYSFNNHQVDPPSNGPPSSAASSDGSGKRKRTRIEKVT